MPTLAAKSAAKMGDPVFVVGGRMRGSFAALKDDNEKQTTATANKQRQPRTSNDNRKQTATAALERSTY
jgi:hypothetical protein